MVDVRKLRTTPSCFLGLKTAPSLENFVFLKNENQYKIIYKLHLNDFHGFGKCR